MGTMAAQPFKADRHGGSKTAHPFFTRSSPACRLRREP